MFINRHSITVPYLKGEIESLSVPEKKNEFRIHTLLKML